MSLSVKSVMTVSRQYHHEVDELLANRAHEANPFLEKLTLQKIRLDIPRLINALSAQKSNRAYDATRKSVLSLSNQVEDLLYDNRTSLKTFASQFTQESQAPEPVELVSEQPQPLVTGDEDYASLRKRLLADGKTTSFDNERKEQMNEYHESFQEEIISDLTAMASTLKNSAQSLSSKIVEDSKLVAESGENMAKSSTLMQSVGHNLNAYLSEKSGGKISLFFMIKTMVFVFILFASMVVVTKILPKM